MLTNTGAYGNHAPGVMFHGCGESLAVYKCANKKVDAHAVYTNTVPAGAFRGYGLSQMIFAIESAIDELAIGIGMDPLEFRRQNMVRPGDHMLSTTPSPKKTSTTAATAWTSALGLGPGRPGSRARNGTGPPGWMTWARTGSPGRARRCP